MSGDGNGVQVEGLRLEAETLSHDKGEWHSLC